MTTEILPALHQEQQDQALRIVDLLALTPLREQHWPELTRLMEAKANVGYADTWTYLTQAASGYGLGLHTTGYFVSRDQARCVVGLFRRPLSGQLAVHLINPLGERRLELICETCEKVANREQILVYIKKADSDLLSMLKTLPSFQWSDHFAWHAMAPKEDDTRPELMLDVSRSLELFEPGRLNQARDKYARFNRKHRHFETMWLPLSAKRYKDARRVIQRFFSHKRERGHIEISEPFDYENMLIAPSPTSRAKGLVREICYIDGNPCALLVMESIGTSNALGLYCNLALYQEYIYLSEFVIHRALTVAFENGFRYMNLGGSESEGLHVFKEKFTPVDRLERKWIVFSPT
jgi:hypothetical protein